MAIARATIQKSSPPSSRPASRPTAATQEKLSAYEELKRSYRGGRYVAFCLDLVLVGTTRDAIGPDGLLEQVRERVGESISLAAHLGVESEIVARRLRARVGSYWEAGRYADSAGRIHGTVSLSVRLFDMRVLGARSLLVAAAFDGAARYTNLGLSIGFWH